MAGTIFNEPAMDDAQAQDDRHGWKIPSGMADGNAQLRMLGDGAGPEVGNQYDLDPMGEQYNAVSYPNAQVTPSGFKNSGGTPSALQEAKSSGGGMVATAPQNYSKAGNGGE